MASFHDSIQDYVGEFIFTGGTGGDSSYYRSAVDILNNSILEVARSLPADLIIPRISKTSNGGSSATLTSTDTHIIAAYNGGVPASRVTVEMFDKAVTNSIYEPTLLDPIYTIDGSKTLKLKPATGANLSYYKVDKPTLTVLSGNFGAHATEIPAIAEDIVILDVSIKLMQMRLKDAVQQEEDNELATAIKTQIETLAGLYQSEAAKLFGAPQQA